MKVQEINPQTLPHNSGYYMKAKHFGFLFKRAEKGYNERLQKKEGIIEDIGEYPKPFKVILSFICIGIALIFAFIEANNVKTTIVGGTGMGETAAIIVGWAFAAAGLVAGHLLATSWRRDEFENKNKPTPVFFIGLAFTLVYLAGQYYLASRAGIGTGAEMQEAVTTMKWFVLGIAVSEVLFGLAFLGTAIKVFTLFIANIRIKIAMAKMNRHSRNCEIAWQRYSFENNATDLLEETQAVKDARAFYDNGGFTGQDENPQL